MSDLLKTSAARGKWRAVQICLVCKTAGRVTITNTVVEMITHINKEHLDG